MELKDDGYMGGPGKPTHEEHVAHLEIDVRSIKETLGRLKATLTGLANDVGEIRTKLAFIEGRLQGMPSNWQLLTIVLMTWTLGTGLLFAVLQFGSP